MTIYDFITKEKTKYEKPIELEDGWSWSMKEHLRRSYLYLNSQFAEDNENRDLRPNKNIILPILNIQYRTEGFDVKDIELYVDNPDEYYKSLLIKKYHDKWALENLIDIFIDDLVVSYCNYGGVLVRKTDKARPEVIDMRSLSFANQTNILDYPFGIKHTMSFVELRKMKKWDKDAIETLIGLAIKEEKDEIEIEEVHGELPSEWLKDNTDDREEYDEYEPQIQIVADYQDENGQKKGITLFSKREPKLPFKFLSRDKIVNRALGRGGVEELFEPQVWTNWNEVKITEMLDSAAKTLHWSDDPSFKSRNNLRGVDNNEVLNLQEGKKIQQLDTYPRNLAVFNDSLERWQNQVQTTSGGPDPAEPPTAGMPFKLYEAQQIESKSMHKYRQGQIAVFMDEIYRDWILPHLSGEIIKEQVFMSELSFEETQEVVEKVTVKKMNEKKKETILSGEIFDPAIEEEELLRIREDLAKGGNKAFFEILKNEMKDISISVMTNIAGKQKNLALLTDKLVNVLRQYLATPELRNDPEMTKLLNTILESSGMSPITFGPSPTKQLQEGGGTTEPLKQLAKEAVPV